jgi:hypothetical protein
MAAPDMLALLRAFVEAHDQPSPQTGRREAIAYFEHSGGGTLHHHGLSDPAPLVDDAVLRDLQAGGLIDVDYVGQSALEITPTPQGRRLIEEHDRVLNPRPAADTTGVLEATAAQGRSENPLGWPAVRPVLASLRAYWQEGGFSAHGVQLLPLLNALPDEQHNLFAVTMRTLIKGDYLRATTDLGAQANGVSLPAEIELTERAHMVLDGWPGASPADLAENLVAVLSEELMTETDPTRKSRLTSLLETIRDVGTATAGEVLAKVLTGGH